MNAGLDRRLASRPPRRIAIVQTAYLGDTVFTSGLVAGVRGRFPGAQVDLCVAPRGRDVAEAIEGVQDVYVFDKNGADRGPLGLLRAARRLSEGRHDLAVLPHRTLRSGLYAWRAGIPERVGFEGSPAGLFCTARAPDQGLTFLEREASLVRFFGGTPQPMGLRPTASQLAQADAALERLGLRGKRFAVLCPGSEWETKMWPAARYADLAASLAVKDLAPLLLGSPKEVPLAESIRAAAKVPTYSAAGNTVGETLGLIARSSLAVGGDSGLVHAARALQIPTVMLFGPTTPEDHAFGGRQAALSLRLDCSPCSEHGQRVCPLGHHKCLRDLGVEAVLTAAAAVLAGPAASGSREPGSGPT